MELHVLNGWNSYRAEVVPADANEVQISETRRAFYAGAVHIFTMLNERCALAGEQAGLDFLDDLSEEFRRYRNQNRKGSG